ncbi:hypothetical protein [Actinomycetospora lemnae]|uniref:Secreted protein n=1 Tax=Actinomycetospora lemnae TaxID=3019891 RepID=A0ABT5SXM4_9PSEU|nr:hypothetical protein [Actinomycetospora sp. DW7H6]MDD7967601.1 hypothetical protein [Actinomycetospora sp. DW7H6]
MLKKMGVVTVGVTAGLLAAAPFASATEGGHHHDGEHKSSGSCNVTGGSAEANGGIDGDSFLGNTLVQAPIGGANLANIVCNDILNDNLSGNTVEVSVLSADEEETEEPGGVDIDPEDLNGNGVPDDEEITAT